ncbi:MAG: Outer rane efflux protein [Phycisphaerales bacterium]|nr:Outer rane efflux protein [Phycisphaerales bacterium]
MRARFLLLLLATLALGGCAQYHAKPLTRPAVEQAITPPSPGELQQRAEKLRHPMLPPVAIDFRRGLTPDSAAVIAVIANPSLRSQRDRRALGSAQLLQAGLLPNPTFDMTLDPVTGGDTAGTVTAFNFGFSWEITSLITHEAKESAARYQLKSIQLDVAWQEWQFAQAAKKAVYDLVALRAQLDEAATVDKRLAENVNLIRRGVDSHDRTILELSAAESAAQKAHADFLTAQHDFRHQQLVLNQSLGLPADANVLIARDVALPSTLDLPSEKELSEGIDQRRLDLRGLRMGYESQEQAVRAAVLAQFPKITFGIHEARDNTNVQSTGFGATIDLPVFDQNQGNIAIQNATREQLFSEYAGRIFDSRAAIAQALTDIRSLVGQIAAAEAAVPSLELLVKTYELAMGQRNVDVLSYYIALNDLAQKRIDILKLKQQLMDNKIVLEIAAGRYLPDQPATGPATRPSTAEARR